MNEKRPRRKDLLTQVVFKDIKTRNIERDLQSWEGSNQTRIQKLLTVLRQILLEAKSTEGPCLVEYYKDGESLMISKLEPGTLAALPEDLTVELSGTT